jgi:hypothetical protein
MCECLFSADTTELVRRNDDDARKTKKRESRKREQMTSGDDSISIGTYMARLEKIREREEEERREWRRWLWNVPTWRRWLSMILAIATFIVLAGIGTRIVDSFGLSTYVMFDEPRDRSNFYYDWEDYGGFTNLGLFILSVSGMVAWRVQRWALTGHRHGRLTMKQQTLWWLWLVGIATYVLSVSFLMLLLEDGWIKLIVELVVLIGVIMACSHLWGRVRTRIEESIFCDERH